MINSSLLFTETIGRLKVDLQLRLKENRSFFKTNKWEVYLPNELKKYSDKEIFIIEDVVLNGESLEREKELVRKCGYKSENVRAAAVLLNSLVTKGSKAL